MVEKVLHDLITLHELLMSLS